MYVSGLFSTKRLPFLRNANTLFNRATYCFADNFRPEVQVLPATNNKNPHLSSQLHAETLAVPGNAIGIDLGHSNMRASFWRVEGNQATCIQNELGNSFTPACVAYANGDPLVGEGALDQMRENPASTVLGALRLIGRRYHDAVVVAGRERWPFSVVEGPGGVPLIEVSTNGVRVRLQPEEIISRLLAEAKKIADARLGENVRTCLQFEGPNAEGRYGPMHNLTAQRFAAYSHMHDSYVVVMGRTFRFRSTGTMGLSTARSVFPGWRARKLARILHNMVGQTGGMTNSSSSGPHS